MRSNVALGVVCAACVLVGWAFSRLFRELLSFYEQSGLLSDLEYSWLFRLLLNVTGYASVLAPVFILYKYLDYTNYFDTLGNPTWVSRALFACFGPYERLTTEPPRRAAPGARRQALELAFCFLGLMAAYLVWGLLQEKIMTQNYVMSDGSVVRFTDSTFLVLVNRFGALIIAVARLLCTRRLTLPAPISVFSYCALTNVLSAWCQYEALKYVSFPTQVLSKSCKVIPVMAMGTLVSRTRYAAHEYATAALISLGMLLFMSGATTASAAPASAAAWSTVTVGGACLLALYLCCDSFTSSWQAAIFARYGPLPLQMLAAVNVWSVLLTAAALPPHSSATSLPPQLLAHPTFLADCAMLSLSSAVGQLLIYRTIASFGPVVFAIIMTVRQAVSILLSCIVYGHAISASGGAGIALVFVAVMLRLYAANRERGRGGKALTPR